MIRRCWADYENCPLDVDADAPELHALASHHARNGGALWIAGDGVGMIGTQPSGDGVWEICRVYVAPSFHGRGLAATLLATAEAHALQSGAIGFELWTDARFTRAHRFYEKHGYERQNDKRTAVDTGGPFTEFHYVKRAVRPALPPRHA